MTIHLLAKVSYYPPLGRKRESHMVSDQKGVG